MILDLARTAASRLRLRRCARVGRGAWVRGRVWVHGRGEVVIGDGVRIDARQAPVELHAGEGARLVIGDRVTLRSGVSIEAMAEVTIGDDAVIDGFARIIDNHLHETVGNRGVRPASEPVTVGVESWIGWRAILLPGAAVPPRMAVPAGRCIRARHGQCGALARGGGAERR